MPNDNDATGGPTPFEKIGKEDGVLRLVTRFYDVMDERVDAKEIRNMHAPDLKVAREKFRLFLTGWLGGPQLYVEKYGHPRLRRRHFPFPIDSAAADSWMTCMDIALVDVIDDESTRQHLHDSFQRIATHMINKDPNDGAR